MKKMKFALFVLGVLVMGNGVAQAKVRRACDSDIAKYCPSDADHGPGCLKGHESDVSAECLKDMQYKGLPPGGTRGHGDGAGGPPPSESSESSS
jgi:hypothetical protein